MVGFPLLIIPFAIYNMIAFLTPGFEWGAVPYTFPVKSGVTWGPSFADMFIVFSLLMLMFEIIKCIRHGRSIVEHFLVLLLAAGAAAEFVLVREAGNSLFMQFVVICFVDLFAGFAAGLRRARRAVVVEQAPAVVGAAPVVRPEPARVEPVTRVEPAPSPFTQRPEPVASPLERTVKVEPVQKIEP